MDKMVSIQDLGDRDMNVERADSVGASGVATLIPDDDISHLDAVKDIRGVIDGYYGNRIDELSDAGEKVLIERVVFRSDDLPHIEYQIVDTSNSDA